LNRKHRTSDLFSRSTLQLQANNREVSEIAPFSSETSSTWVLSIDLAYNSLRYHLEWFKVRREGSIDFVRVQTLSFVEEGMNWHKVNTPLKFHVLSQGPEAEILDNKSTL
jgi:hypothetical protein